MTSIVTEYNKSSDIHLAKNLSRYTSIHLAHILVQLVLLLLVVKVSISFPNDLLKKLDEKRQDIPRCKFVVGAFESKLLSEESQK